MSAVVKLIPHDVAAEREVIGGVLVHPRVLIEARWLLDEEFYDPRHAAIWSAMTDLADSDKPIDALTVATAMREAKTFEKLAPLGGENYFLDLMSGVVTVENIRHHAMTIRQVARRRAWLSLATNIAARARDESISPEEFIADAEAACLAMTSKLQPGVGPRRMAPLLHEYTKLLEKRYESGGAITGLLSRLTELDELTCGFHPGELIIIAARPSMGKTALALNVVAEAAKQKHPCLMFSLEMANLALVERMVANECGVELGSLKRGRLHQTDWMNYTRGASRLSTFPIWIEDNAGMSVLDMRTTARQWKAEQKVADENGIVVVDYLQIAEGGVERFDNNRQAEVAFMSRQLKLMAKELKLPVVALSQVNRKCEDRADKRPMMSDLRESGAIEQDADVVAFLYRDEYYNKDSDAKGVTEIILGKARNGETGVAKVGWDGKHQRFVNLPT